MPSNIVITLRMKPNICFGFYDNKLTLSLQDPFQVAAEVQDGSQMGADTHSQLLEMDQESQVRQETLEPHLVVWLVVQVAFEGTMFLIHFHLLLVLYPYHLSFLKQDLPAVLFS